MGQCRGGFFQAGPREEYGKLDIDPIHLGIVYVVNMEIGLVTPPVGLNLIVASSITGMQLTEVVRAAIGWLMIRLGFLIVVTCIPEIWLYFPNIMFGKPA